MFGNALGCSLVPSGGTINAQTNANVEPQFVSPDSLGQLRSADQPGKGQTVTYDGLKFTVERVQGRRIAKVLISRQAEQDQEAAGESARG